MSHLHPMGIHNTSTRLSTGDDQALYSYPFGMEDDYKDFK
ncbi:unnamed protein product, partial [Rotaria magnacalcarata]